MTLRHKVVWKILRTVTVLAAAVTLYAVWLLLLTGYWAPR